MNPADNDHVSASLYALAKQHHFSSVDQAALSQQTATAAAGENIFIVQGPPTIRPSSVRTCQRRASPPSTKANHEAGCNIDSRFRSTNDAVSVFAVENIEP
ncbi:XVIPCD domain-containing protein [uncultured Xanthomonas sp.]|uniref:XVIPCD domain-containing protein n=1 Tax=uncultured Xanthomonas sp. TaxID=152831 RepID=UPI0025CD9F42|nr:XVIPCD domain-containing protein [uncultured Xanthomonas sp.]